MSKTGKIDRTLTIFRHDALFCCTVAGCDESGRGPLAGPVVCAACSLPFTEMIDGIFDSKCVSESRRETLFKQIIDRAISYKISIIDNKTIDKINILNATKLGMKQAVDAVMSKLESVKPEGLNEGFYADDNAKLAAATIKTKNLMLLDAVKLDTDYPTLSLIKGDAKSYNIAAASILAKVTRDRIMIEYHRQYPEYNFAKNKGYGTAEHICAIKKFGATPLHRASFIKNFI